MTSYIDIDRSPEAIHDDEEIIEAVERVSSKAVELVIWNVKDDVTTVQNIFDTVFPFVKVWRNNYDIFWVDMQHFSVMAVLFVVFFLLLSPWQSEKRSRGNKASSSSSSSSSRNRTHYRTKDCHDRNDPLTNNREKSSEEPGRWWAFTRCSRSRSRSRTRHAMRRSWSLFSPNTPYPMERSKSFSTLCRTTSSSSPTRQSSSARAQGGEHDGTGSSVATATDFEDDSDEEEKFAKRWPYIRQTHYGCLVLPPECKRVEKPKNVSSRLPGAGSMVSTTASSKSQTNEQKENTGTTSTNNVNKSKTGGGGDGTDYDNPAARITNYMKHIYPWRIVRGILLWIDYPTESWALMQSARRLAVALAARRQSATAASIVSHNTASDDDDDEEASVESSSTTQSHTSRNIGGWNGRSSSAADGSATLKTSMNGEKTPIQTNRTKSSSRRRKRGKQDRERRLEDAPLMPPDEESMSSSKNSPDNHQATKAEMNGEPTLTIELHPLDKGKMMDVACESMFVTSVNGDSSPEQRSLDGRKHEEQSSYRQNAVITSDVSPQLGPLQPSSPKYHTPLRDYYQVDTKFLLSTSTTKIPALGMNVKPRDALESYQANSVRQLESRTTPILAKDSSFSRTDVATNSNGSSNASQFFFEAAMSRQSLSQMNVEIPVPDRHGYIVGDEFLPNSSFCPLLVFVNSRSGPQQGHLLITQLRGLLNPIQVWDLADGDPKKILESFSVFSRLRILVCGGDGTVSWIVSTIEGMNLQKWPPIAILPLGTGNDLAQIHGWGSGYNNESLIGILDQVADSYISWLDRWEMTIETKKGKVKEVKSFFNYLGVGADAQAALQVHMLRESRPDLFFSRLINKAWYGFFGAEDIFKASSVNLPNDVTLIADGVEVPLPEDSQGIILLNIDSYSGGVKLWANGHKVIREDNSHFDGNLSHAVPMKRSKSLDALRGRRVDSVEDLTAFGSLTDKEKYDHVTSCDRPSSCQDGLLDIVSIRGPFHLGQIRVGISTAEKLCQCREATIYIRRRHSVQIDGEPWRQDPCTLKVRKKKDAAIMLHRSADESNGVESEMAKLLDWAEESSLIDSDVHAAMMREFSRRIESKTRERRDKTNDKTLFSLKRTLKSANNLNGRPLNSVQRQKQTSMGVGASGIAF